MVLYVCYMTTADLDCWSLLGWYSHQSAFTDLIMCVIFSSVINLLYGYCWCYI